MRWGFVAFVLELDAMRRIFAAALLAAALQHAAAEDSSHHHEAGDDADQDNGAHATLVFVFLGRRATADLDPPALDTPRACHPAELGALGLSEGGRSQLSHGRFGGTDQGPCRAWRALRSVMN